MKTLFIGGIKSGKSLQAEQYVLEHFSTQRPYYLATTEFIDAQMKTRIKIHQKRREDQFITIEESLDLHKALANLDRPILIECTSMWINNMLFHKKDKEQIIKHIKKVLALSHDMIFVHNDVGSGVIPDNSLARTYVDISGMLAQIIASECDEVYHCVAGIATKIKG